MVAASWNTEAGKNHSLQAKLFGMQFLAQPQVCWSFKKKKNLPSAHNRNSSNSNNLSLATQDKIVKSCNDLEIRYIHEVNLEILNKSMYKNGERLRKLALEFPY